MKNHPHHHSLLLPLAVLALTLAGCPDSTARDHPAGNEPRSLAADAPAGELDLKAYAFEQRAEFAAAVKDAAAKVDARIAALGSPPAAGGPASEARGKAVENLRSYRAILDERIAKIDQAIAGNWESVRREVIAALTQVQAGCERAERL